MLKVCSYRTPGPTACLKLLQKVCLKGWRKDTHDILLKHQYGFRSRHLCETQLLTIIDDFAKAINDKKQVDTCMLDFSKAFDKIPQLHKLEFYGITGDTLSWLTAFLSDRSQPVTIHGALSRSILEYLKGLFLAQHFSLCTSMT